jgi:hypothetical protein
MLSVWWLQVAKTMCSYQGLADMHFMYGMADGNVVVARTLYHERYPGVRCLDSRTFVSIHRYVCENGNGATRVSNRRRLRSTSPDTEEDIPEIVNVTLGIIKRTVSVQVGVVLSNVWRVARTTAVSLPSAACTGLASTRLPLTERCSASNDYNGVVQILTSLHLWCNPEYSQSASVDRWQYKCDSYSG